MKDRRAEFEYYYGKIMIDGQPVSIMLTEAETETATQRALDNIEHIPPFEWKGDCWEIDCCNKTKCSLLHRIMGRCCECGDC